MGGGGGGGGVVVKTLVDASVKNARFLCYMYLSTRYYSTKLFHKERKLLVSSSSSSSSVLNVVIVFDLKMRVAAENSAISKVSSSLIMA